MGWLRGVGALFAVSGVLLGCDNNSAQTDAGEAGTPAPMADEGTPAPMADAIACSPVIAADYDQSCTVDSDCVAVGEVAQCPASACDECRTGAVSKSAAAKYQVDLSAAFASHPGGSDCSCACASGAICRASKCQAASCGADLDAGADADARADAGPDAGSCTAALSTFHCPATYPSDLSAACLSAFQGVSSATCDGLAAIAQGGPPHWSFCVYQGVDAGALVGAQSITDIPELCNNTSDTITGGQVPASCSQAIYQQINPSVDGSVTIVCDGGASPRDAGLE
jgi:hypothetical protein